MLSTAGTPASAQSSPHAWWCSTVRPRPPYSSGQWTLANPAACIRCCHSMPCSRRSAGMIAPQFGGAVAFWASSHASASARNSSTLITA